MTKSNKQRAGLQKKVSSVFKGVSIPGAKRTGEPSQSPASDRKAVSPNPKPDRSRSLYSPEADNASQSEVLASRANLQSTPVAKPLVSTDAKIAPSRSAEKPSLSTKSHRTTDPEQAATHSPTACTEPNMAQGPAMEKRDEVDGPADDATTEKTVGSASRQSGQSSIVARLDESQEPQDTITDSPSASTASKRTESPSDQPATEKGADSAAPASADRQKSSSLARRLAQTDESTNESKPLRTPSTPTSTNRQISQAHKSRDVRQPERPPARSALADPFVDGVDESGFLQQMKDKLIPSEGASIKDKVMIMLVPILAIVMIFVFRQVLHKPPGKVRAAGKEDETSVASVDPGDDILWTIPEPLPTIARDPLKIAQPDEPENPNQDVGENPGQAAGTDQTQFRYLQVRDIVHSRDRATALVGNQIVRAGSTINGITIVRINRDSVELERNGETWIQRVRD